MKRQTHLIKVNSIETKIIYFSSDFEFVKRTDRVLEYKFSEFKPCGDTINFLSIYVDVYTTYLNKFLIK
jgi:hypothetical protein